jgi:hypothetical protein
VEGFNMKGAVRGLLPLKGLETLEVHQAVGEDVWGYEKLTALTSLTDCIIRQYSPALDVAVFGSKVSGADSVCFCVATASAGVLIMPAVSCASS